MANILIVDSSPVAMETISGMLMQTELAVKEIYEAVDSNECLNLLSSGKMINIVISNATSLDGKTDEFVSAIRRKRRFLPILMTSATEDEAGGDVLSAGAIDVLARPFTPEQLQEKVVGLACEFKCIYCGNCKQ